MADKDRSQELLKMIATSKNPANALDLALITIQMFLEALGIPTDEQGKEVR